MKKLFLIVVTFLTVVNVDALETSEVYIKREEGLICTNENKYPVYFMRSQNVVMYFLNPSLNYNLNFDDYYEIPFEESIIPESIADYSGQNLPQSDIFFNISIHRILWERLYPDIDFIECKSMALEKYYLQTKEMVYDVDDGPNFIKETVYQEPLKEYEYTDDYLKYFEIISSEGLNALIKNNTLKVMGDEGKYQITLQRKKGYNDEPNKLYTDGSNYLLLVRSVPKKEYYFDIVIGIKEYSIDVRNDKGQSLSNVCFMVDENQICTDENGKLNFETSSEEVEIALINTNDEYLNYDKKINLKEETFDISLVENVNENEEETIIINSDSQEQDKVIIKVKDTFAYSGFLTGLLVIYFVYFKKI